MVPIALRSGGDPRTPVYRAPPWGLTAPPPAVSKKKGPAKGPKTAQDAPERGGDIGG